MTIRIAVGRSEYSNEITHKEVTWEQIVNKYSRHTESKKKGGEYVIGGFFDGSIRKEDKDNHMLGRSLLVVDIDKFTGTIADLEFALGLLDYKFVAYSSFRHTNAMPRIRLIIPLSRNVTPDEYRVLALQACHDLSIPFEAVDACSWKPNQPMFSPQHPAGGEFWTMAQDGTAYEVPGVFEARTVALEAEASDLDALVAAQPLDLSDEQVMAYLAAYPASGLDYSGWLTVGMALHHQYAGSADGFAMWSGWSALDEGRFNADLCEAKWASFGAGDNPVTMASVIQKVKESGGLVEAPSAFEALLAEAAAVVDFTQFNAFKKRIAAMPEQVLPPVGRSRIAAEVHENFGIANKVTKSAITKELQPNKKARTLDASAPAWLAPWVYVENTCSFAHSEVPDYHIKREAFNAKFDREPECVGAEKQAAHLALVQYKLDTVVDTLFFPRADKFFEYEGKRMMNSFSAKGVAPCDTLDAGGKAAIEKFKAHLAFTLADKGEQALFINWMAYIYQNPGKRVGWAMLLQGAQGTGKSYFGNVLEELLGSNVKSLDTGAISGRFTGWATGSLVVVVEEIRIAGTNKYQILDKLKPIISNNTIQIEEKGRDHRTVPNFTSYLLLTNHKDAVPLQDGDRRYCALFSRVQSEDQLFDELGGRDAARDYFDSLFDSLRARPDALARFFADHKVPVTFDPSGRAPETTARLEMKALSVSPDRDIVENAIERHRCGIINDETIDLTWLNRLVQGEGETLPKAWSLAAILSDMGFSPITGRRVKITGAGYHYVWTRKVCDSDDIKVLVKKYHLMRDNL